ncbi:MAG: hypothetical protein JNM84_24880 [Planctomycetes bacterium]|nr:hypothetical protein [Planctomycetota bacterium]
MATMTSNTTAAAILRRFFGPGRIGALGALLLWAALPPAFAAARAAAELPAVLQDPGTPPPAPSGETPPAGQAPAGEQPAAGAQDQPGAGAQDPTGAGAQEAAKGAAESSGNAQPDKPVSNPQEGEAAQNPARSGAPRSAPGARTGSQEPYDETRLRFEGEYISIDLPTENDPSTNKKRLNLYQLMLFTRSVTGLNFYLPERGDEDALRKEEVVLFGPKRVPTDRFYDFFQILLKLHNFACVEVGSEPLQVIRIVRLQGEGLQALKSSIFYIKPTEIDQYANRPASLVVTIIPLQYVEPQQATTMLSRFFSNAALEGFASLGTNATEQRALMVVGFGPTVNSISQLLREIDTPPLDIQPEIVIVPLEHAAADEIEPTLSTFFDRVAPRAGSPQQAAQAAGSTAAEIRFSVDSRTNSIIVRALPEVIPDIRDMIAQLDIPVPTLQSNYKVFELKNVAALDLQEVLEEFLSDASQEQNRTQTTQGGQQRREQRPVVVADEASNSILVSASKTRMSEIRRLIQQLDQRQDQVLIECALVELTSSNNFNLAVELGAAKIPGAGEQEGFGFNSFGLSTLTDLDNDGLPDTRQINTTLQGLTGGILDGDDFAIPFLINALKTRRDANILSVPSILVNNNSDATIESKDEFPTTTQTASANVGNTVTFAGYEEAGITLNISPSISSEHYLRLNVALSVSTFSGAFEENAQVPPPRITRQVQTQVFLPSGSTMVIGGITIDNDTMTKNSMPILGDLPLIGWLFSSNADSATKTTLYFFVTPHILRDEDFTDLRALSHLRKANAVNVIGEDKFRLVDPTFQKNDATGATLPRDAFEIVPMNDEGLEEPKPQPADPAGASSSEN